MNTLLILSMVLVKWTYQHKCKHMVFVVILGWCVEEEENKNRQTWHFGTNFVNIMDVDLTCTWLKKLLGGWMWHVGCMSVEGKQTLALATHESPSFFYRFGLGKRKHGVDKKYPETYRGNASVDDGTHDMWFDANFYSCSHCK